MPHAPTHIFTYHGSDYLNDIGRISAFGARLSYSDPNVPRLQLDGIDVEAQPESLASEADCAVIITNHSSFDYREIAAQSRLIVDTRNALQGIEGAHIVRL